MATATAIEYLERTPNGSVKSFFVTITKTTAATTDSFTVDLQTYGIAEDGLLGINAWDHTSDGSIITSNETFYSSVSSGTLTLVVGGTAAKYKVFEIIGKSDIGNFTSA